MLVLTAVCTGQATEACSDVAAVITKLRRRAVTAVCSGQPLDAAVDKAVGTWHAEQVVAGPLPIGTT